MFNDPDLNKIYNENISSINKIEDILDGISNDIKNLESTLKKLPYSEGVELFKKEFSLIVEKGRIVYVDDNNIKKNLIETKSEIRLKCREFLTELFEIVIKRMRNYANT